jgi:hypothetical protein
MRWAYDDQMVLRLVVVVVAVLGCGSNHKSANDAPMADAQVDAFTGVCDVLAQTGCPSGQKCTWIEDNNASPPAGHIGCAPIGPVALGGACTWGAPGPTGYDNCGAGDVCLDAVCKQICDMLGVAPTCGSGMGCGLYSGVFGPVAGPYAAGACDPTCDPFADNTFNKGSKPGSGCAATDGCYGLPDSMYSTQYHCGHPQTNLGNRRACTGACGPYLNGCGQGFVPLLIDQTGSQQVDCISYCKPADCSSAGCGTNGANLPGDPANASDGRRHQCNTTDSSGLFSPATLTNNGDQCFYEWWFDVDATGKLVKSPTMNSVGFCMNHSKYAVPTNKASTTQCTSTTSTGCEAIPLCSSLPPVGTATTWGAVDFGCVSTTTGMVPSAAPPLTIDRPRMLYHATMAP